MNLIATPEKWKNLSTWVDAYTATLEACADASQHHEIRGAMTDALKEAQSQARVTGSEQDIQIAQAQQRINKTVMNVNHEQLRELINVWLTAAKQIKPTCWDLAADVTYALEPNKEQVRFWQGESPTKDFILMPLAPANLAIRFLKFVASNSPSFSPIEYTKQMLIKQGITKENFHLHKDKMAITNPWDPVV